MDITSTHRPGSDATVGERSNSKKFLRTRKIMVMHSNERGECSPRVVKEILLGNVVISKKFLRTRKIMVMHSNERGECCLRTLVDRSGSVDAT